MVTGAAPISSTVLNFLRAALGCQVLNPVPPAPCHSPPHPLLLLTSRPIPSQIFEAYGQTECTAGCTFTTPGDATSGSDLRGSQTETALTIGGTSLH